MTNSLDYYRNIIPVECCARCGYNELISSLHVHHMDQNHDNDVPDNLIVLCANCHFGLHHKRWKLSEIGIFGFDTKIKRSNNFKELLILKQQNTQLTNENIILKEQAKLLKLPHNENHDIQMIKKKMALYGLLSKFGYKIRDEVAFFFDNIQDNFFDHVISEDDRYTRDLVDNIHELYMINRQQSNEININEFNDALKVRMNNGEDNRKSIKERKIEGLTLAELMRRIPLK